MRYHGLPTRFLPRRLAKNCGLAGDSQSVRPDALFPLPLRCCSDAVIESPEVAATGALNTT